MSTAPPKSYYVSAPAKVILFGEHAVVYGKAAIAASAGLCTYLAITPTPTPTLELAFADVEVHETWALSALHALTLEARKHPHIAGEFDASLHQRLSAIVSFPEGPKQSATLAFLYLFCRIAPVNGSQGWRVSVRSAIPVGAGLGSSASFSVCLSAALLLAHGHLLTSTSPHPDTAALDAINAWAFQAETIIHGQPSGVDNFVCTHGGAVSFSRGVPPKALSGFNSLSFILTSTRIPRNTRKQLEKVKSLIDRHPAVAAAIMEAIHAISLECERLASPDHPASPEETSTALGELIDLNQSLLNSLGTGHPALDRICSLTAGIGLHSKLTGAGGGGCALTLIPHSEDGRPAKLRVLLEGAGYTCWETSVAGPGVRALVSSHPASSVEEEDAHLLSLFHTPAEWLTLKTDL